MVVTLSADALSGYDRFSLYNSPFPAHDAGRAVDLYPGGATAPSPVAGGVRDVLTVDAPPASHATEHDHLILIDVGDYVARVLHVDPAVEPGETVSRGDPLGELVTSGFFAPWVDDHVHLGFRRPESNLRRASGSLPLALDVRVEPVAWDGTGEVVETGETYAVLDAPGHPEPGEYFVGLDGGAGVLDGGLPHYDRGGLLRGVGGVATLAGRRVGALDGDGRTVAWDDVRVLANDQEITGLSLFLARDAGFGAKLVCPDRSFEVGESVTVEVAAATAGD